MTLLILNGLHGLLVYANCYILYYLSDIFCLGNQLVVLFAILTSKSMTGTSTSTPTTVASAAGDVVPNNAIATATDSSKKFEAPIIPAGAATLCGNFRNLPAK